MKVSDSDVLAWVRGQRKVSQVLGAFELLDFTCYGPFLHVARFETYQQFISLIFQFIFGPW
jgi:nitrate reductase NapE component